MADQGYDPNYQQEGEVYDQGYDHQQGQPYYDEQGGHYDPQQQGEYDQYDQQYPPQEGGYDEYGGQNDGYDQYAAGGAVDGQAQYYDQDGQAYDQQYYEQDPNYDPNDPNNYQYDENTYGESVPDVLLLSQYCANAIRPRDETEEARIEADASWGPVREWLSSHSAEEVRAAAEQRDDSQKTALHFACQFSPPLDVIEVFLSVGVDIVQWPDGFGWLPIHYVCAYGADYQVIKVLAEAFPESKTTIDRKGRTPLHFALGNSTSNTPAVVVLLSSTGAASYADDNGMLPLHYACAYGASEEALMVLTDANRDAITTVDRKGRTPLHFALSNAGRKAAPAAVRHLVNLNKNLVNSIRGGPLPLRVLSEFAATVRKNDRSQRESCQRCLEYLLACEPDPTADYFTSLQSLPDFLQERAVVMAVVQTLLNDKIAQRFPTLILMLDFYFQILVVTAYSAAVTKSVDERYSEEPDADPASAVEGYWITLLYIGGTYFFLREMINILSLLSLKSFHIWLYEPSNWLNVAYIFLVFFWTIAMNLGEVAADTFRIGAALSVSIIWLKFLAYLRNMLIDFAVFSGGVFYVVRRLAAFLLALIIILVAFSRMFYTVFLESDYCKNDPQRLEIETDEVFLANLQCEDNQLRSWCHSWDSWLTVYTMLLGEVDEDLFEDNLVALSLFIVFMFLVVILLANVLIAIVTDSYKVIQDQRAAIVFWTNRLDFIAQMDAIANGPWKARLRRSLGMHTDESSMGLYEATFGKDFWKRLMDLFEDDVDDSIFSFEFLCYTLLRVATIVFIIPAWILLGILTAGWFWPPQIREYVFTSTVFKHATESDKEDELRKTQVKKLREEINVLRDDLLQELTVDRTQVVQLKSVVTERKLEIQNEMKHIKRIVAMLFEQQSSM